MASAVFMTKTYVADYATNLLYDQRMIGFMKKAYNNIVNDIQEQQRRSLMQTIIEIETLFAMNNELVLEQVNEAKDKSHATIKEDLSNSLKELTYHVASKIVKLISAASASVINENLPYYTSGKFSPEKMTTLGLERSYLSSCYRSKWIRLHNITVQINKRYVAYQVAVITMRELSSDLLWETLRSEKCSENTVQSPRINIPQSLKRYLTV